MAIRWQADMVRPQMGGAVGNGTLHARGSAFYLAGFDLCPAKRARGRTGDSALLGDSDSRPHICFEDGANGKLELQERGRAFGSNVHVAAIRLTMNALSSAGGKVTATILQAGIG